MENKDLAWSIIALYLHNPMDLLSINEISRRLKKKYPYVHKRTNELIGENILNMISVGRSNMCALNLENPYTRYMLGWAELKSAAKNSHKPEVPDCLIALACGRNKNKLYIVGSSKKKKADEFNCRFLSREEFKKALLEDSDHCYSDHIIFRGIESFMLFLKENSAELKMRYNPLLRGLL